MLDHPLDIKDDKIPGDAVTSRIPIRVSRQEFPADPENDINGLEQFGFSKVTKYVKQTTGAVAGTPLNEATLDDVPAGLSPGTKRQTENRFFPVRRTSPAPKKAVLGFRPS